MSFVYEEIADVYRKKIEAGELSPGDKFPTYDEMVAEWNVSTNTVVEVRKVLYREGLITRGQGFAGTFVTDAMPVPTTPAPKRKSRRLTYIHIGGKFIAADVTMIDDGDPRIVIVTPKVAL